MTAPYNRCKSAIKKITPFISAQDAPCKRGRDAVRSQRSLYKLRASATDNISVRTAAYVRVRGAPVAEILLRGYGELKATPCALFKTPRDGVRLCTRKCAPSVGVLGDTTALLRRCLQSYCAHFGVLGRRENATLM